VRCAAEKLHRIDDEISFISTIVKMNEISSSIWYNLSVGGVLKGCAAKFLDCATRKGIGKVRTHKKRFVY